MTPLERLRTNYDDVMTFGPSILLRHLGRIRKDRLVKVNANGMAVMVRAGDSDIAAVRQVFGKLEYDMRGLGKAWGRLSERYKQITAQGGKPLIVDAGANIGTATLWFKQQFPAAAIVAVEPDPENAKLLRANVSGLKDVFVMEAAIGSEQGFVKLVDSGLSWAIQTERAARGVRVVTIADALAQVENQVPFIAKIDIEGFERDLFSASTEWISDMAAIIIEPHDWMLPGEYSSVPFQRAIGAHKFEMFHSGENIFYIR